MNDLLMQTTTNVVEETRPVKQVDYLLLDGSGSMAGRWLESLDALDKYAAGLKTQGVDSTILMATFSDGRGLEYSVVRETNVAAWQPLVLNPPTLPGGMTPLYDSINVMVRSLRDLNPDKCSIIIVTDGDENGSRTTNETQARGLLDWCRSRGWQVTFIGCDFNNSRLVKLLGGGDSAAIGAPTKRLTDITSELAKKRHYHDKFGTPMGFSDEEKKQFGGYLSDQSSNGK